MKRQRLGSNTKDVDKLMEVIDALMDVRNRLNTAYDFFKDEPVFLDENDGNEFYTFQATVEKLLLLLDKIDEEFIEGLFVPDDLREVASWLIYVEEYTHRGSIF